MIEGLILIAFSLFGFAILGVQLFHGSLHQICVEQVEWPKNINFNEQLQVDSFYNKWILNASKYGQYYMTILYVLSKLVEERGRDS